MVKQQKQKKTNKSKKLMGNGDTDDRRMTDRQWTINRQTVILQTGTIQTMEKGQTDDK